MRGEHHKVARACVLYGEERAGERAKVQESKAKNGEVWTLPTAGASRGIARKETIRGYSSGDRRRALSHDNPMAVDRNRHGSAGRKRLTSYHSGCRLCRSCQRCEARQHAGASQGGFR
jgi:hypothetical protein